MIRVGELLPLRHNLTHAVPALPASTVAVSAVPGLPFGFRRLDTDDAVTTGILRSPRRDDERRHDVSATTCLYADEVRTD